MTTVRHNGQSSSADALEELRHYVLTHPPIRAGVLGKQGGPFRMWKNRWFVLCGLKLVYYEKEVPPNSDAGIVGAIDLDNCSLYPVVADKHGLTFQIVSLGAKSYLLKALSPADNEEWVAALKASIAAGGGMGSGRLVGSCLLEGFLEKQGFAVRSWKKRWFVLSNNFLYYFDPAQKASQCLNTIPLADATVLDIEGSVEGRQFCFQLQTTYRDFLIACYSTEDLAQWCTALRRQCPQAINESAARLRRGSALPYPPARGALPPDASFTANVTAFDTVIPFAQMVATPEPTLELREAPGARATASPPPSPRASPRSPRMAPPVEFEAAAAAAAAMETGVPETVFKTIVQAFNKSWGISVRYSMFQTLHRKLLEAYPQLLFPHFPELSDYEAALSVRKKNQSSWIKTKGSSAIVKARKASLLPRRSRELGLDDDPISSLSSTPDMASPLGSNGFDENGDRASVDATSSVMMREAQINFIRSYLAEVAASTHITCFPPLLTLLEVTAPIRAAQCQSFEMIDFIQMLPVVLERVAPDRPPPQLKWTDPDEKGDTVTHHVVRAADNPEFLNHVLQCGAPKTTMNNAGESPLYVACQQQRSQCIKVIMAALDGKHLSDRGPNGLSPLHVCARLGDSTSVRLLLQAKADCNAVDDRGSTPLHFAAVSSEDVVQQLLQYGASVTLDNQGDSPFHLAARAGLAGVLRVLSASGFKSQLNVRQGDRHGRTPLHLAVRAARVDSVSVLLEVGAEPGAQEKSGLTPVHLATGAKDKAIVLLESLFAAGAPLDAVDIAGQTPLHTAVAADDDTVVRWLLDHGSKTDAVDSNGRTPLIQSCALGAGKALVVLATADGINQADAKGYTALHHATRTNFLAGVSILLKAGADPNAGTDAPNAPAGLRWRTLPVHVASELGSSDLVKVFITAGTDKDVQDVMGRTCLHLACLKGHIDVAAYFLSTALAKMDIFDAQEPPCLPLHTAIIAGHSTLARSIYERMKGFRMSTRQPGTDKTALHIAVELGTMEMLSVMLSVWRDDLGARDALGNSALHYAAMRGEAGMIDALLRQGANGNAINAAGATPVQLAPVELRSRFP